VELVSTELYTHLSEQLADEKAISALHWILIQRATIRFAKATIFEHRQDDKLMMELLTEPLRAMRHTDAVMRRIEDVIAKVLLEALPDPADRARAMTRIVDVD